MACYSFLIATSFSVGAVVADQLDPIVLTLLRMSLATVLFAIPVTLAGHWQRPTLGSLGRHGAIGFCITFYFIMMFEALRWTTPLNTGSILTFVPLMTAGISLVLLGQRPTGPLLFWLCVGCLGALWVIFGGRLERMLALDLGKGDLIFFAGCVTFALYSPLIRRLHRGESLLLLNFWVVALGAVMLLVYGFPRILATDWPAVPGEVFFWTAYLACFPTAITFYLIKYASTRLPSAKVMAYIYLTPGFVVLVQAAVGHGWPEPRVLAGVVVTAFVLIALQTRRLS